MTREWLEHVTFTKERGYLVLSMPGYKGPVYRLARSHLRNRGWNVEKAVEKRDRRNGVYDDWTPVTDEAGNDLVDLPERAAKAVAARLMKGMPRPTPTVLDLRKTRPSDEEVEAAGIGVEDHGVAVAVPKVASAVAAAKAPDVGSVAAHVNLFLDEKWESTSGNGGQLAAMLKREFGVTTEVAIDLVRSYREMRNVRMQEQRKQEPKIDLADVLAQRRRGRPPRQPAAPPPAPADPLASMKRDMQLHAERRAAADVIIRRHFAEKHAMTRVVNELLAPGGVYEGQVKTAITEMVAHAYRRLREQPNAPTYPPSGVVHVVETPTTPSTGGGVPGEKTKHGGPRTQPDKWAPPKDCEGCGHRMYTTWADARRFCRKCEAKGLR
jgi:hypothetical protein